MDPLFRDVSFEDFMLNRITEEQRQALVARNLKGTGFLWMTPQERAAASVRRGPPLAPPPPQPEGG